MLRSLRMSAIGARRLIVHHWELYAARNALSPAYPLFAHRTKIVLLEGLVGRLRSRQAATGRDRNLDALFNEADIGDVAYRSAVT